MTIEEEPEENFFRGRAKKPKEILHSTLMQLWIDIQQHAHNVEARIDPELSKLFIAIARTKDFIDENQGKFASNVIALTIRKNKHLFRELGEQVVAPEVYSTFVHALRNKIDDARATKIDTIITSGFFETTFRNHHEGKPVLENIFLAGKCALIDVVSQLIEEQTLLVKSGQRHRS